MRRMLAPTLDSRLAIQIPDQATSTTNRCEQTSDRSDMEPNPKARRKPKSIRSKVPKPNGHRDTAPNPLLARAPKRCRTPAHVPSDRKHPDPANRCNSGRCDSSFEQFQLHDRDRYSSYRNHLSAEQMQFD